MARESSPDRADAAAVTFRGTGWGLPDSLHLAAPSRILKVESDRPGDLHALLLELDVHARSGRGDQILAGFLSYEAGVFLEGSRRLFRPPSRTPLAWFGLFDIEDAAAAESHGYTSGTAAGVAVSDLDRAAFMSGVGEIRDGIARGDVYQVNLTRRLTLPVAMSSRQLAQALYEDNPVPFALHLSCESFAVVTNSPELFLRCDLGRRTAESGPIKGTVSRFDHPGEDARAIRRLQTSEKDLAEHVMIVDLVRNDLGKVAPAGTVRVPEFEVVRSFRHLHHLESTVRSRLDSHTTLSDVLLAAFPGGSITGAPKRASLSFIRRLEPSPRGPYTGALGFVRGDGTAVFNIGIRTAILSSEGVDYHAGCGIVWDSDPASEWEETEIKSVEFARATSTLPPEGRSS